MSFPVRHDEARRLATLRELYLLDTRAHEAIDQLVEIAQLHFETKIAAVTLLDDDRQWLYSVDGLDIRCTGRAEAFCNYTILSDQVLETTNAVEDPRFAENPLVAGEPRIRYYIGAPVTVAGAPLGALCMVDFEARAPAPASSRRLIKRAAAAVSHEISNSLRLRRATDELASFLAAGVV